MERRLVRKKQKLHSAISHYQSKLEKEVAYFRECAQTYDMESIATLLPLMLQNIQNTHTQLKKLNRQMHLISFFIEDETI